MSKKINHISLIVMFIVYSLFIILQSIYDKNGFVTSDSAHYLQLAQNILNGDGLSTANYVEGMSTYFATWPIGYPVLIAIISFMTPFNVFWAAKIVNMICLAICLILLQRLFQNRAYIVAVVLFVSSFTKLFVYTWSEVPFILGLLWLVFGLERFIKTDGQFKYVVHLFLAALFLFFMRYIGLIGAGIIGLVGFYYFFQKKWRQMILCWVSGSLAIVIAGIYLMINYMNTGLMTGMERIPRTETAKQFVSMLYKAVISEFNLFYVDQSKSILATIIVIAIALIIFIRPAQLRALFTVKRDQLLLPTLFLFTGIVYFIAIVYMRWSAYFDTFYFRLLSPASFLFILCLLSLIVIQKDSHWIRWQNAIILIFLTLFTYNIVIDSYNVVTSDDPTYKETKAQILNDYEVIPKGSIVAFENVHARYLRPDIQFIKVHFQPYFAHAESVSSYIERITPNDAAGVFVQTKSLKGYKYDESFVDIMEDAQEINDTFINLNDIQRKR